MDILHQMSLTIGIQLPEFVSIGFINGSKKETDWRREQMSDRSADKRRFDWVKNQFGLQCCGIRLPKSGAVLVIKRAEIENPIDVGQIVRVRIAKESARADILDQHRTVFCAIRNPQFAPVVHVGWSKKQTVVNRR